MWQILAKTKNGVIFAVFVRKLFMSYPFVSLCRLYVWLKCHFLNALESLLDSLECFILFFANKIIFSLVVIRESRIRRKKKLIKK